MWCIQDGGDFKFEKVGFLWISNSFHQEETDMLALDGHLRDMLFDFISASDCVFLALLDEFHVFLLPCLNVPFDQLLFWHHYAVV